MSLPSRLRAVFPKGLLEWGGFGSLPNAIAATGTNEAAVPVAASVT